MLFQKTKRKWTVASRLISSKTSRSELLLKRIFTATLASTSTLCLASQRKTACCSFWKDNEHYSGVLEKTEHESLYTVVVLQLSAEILQCRHNELSSEEMESFQRSICWWFILLFFLEKNTQRDLMYVPAHKQEEACSDTINGLVQGKLVAQ